MADPNNPILFPVGQTCEIYSFGFTSGCTDDDGIGRGFTQEWYYDAEVGAWLSVTAVGGSGLNIDEDSYTWYDHASPPYVSNVPGVIRKFAILEENGAGLTFDYIKLSDLLGPNEVGFSVAGFNWLYLSQVSHSNTPTGFGWDTSGLTLCAPAGTTYYYWDSTSSSTAFEFYINRTSGTQVSPFAIHPTEAGFTTCQIENSYSGWDEEFDPAGDPDGIPADIRDETLSDYYTGNSGEILISNNSVRIELSTSDSTKVISSSVFRPYLRYTDLDTGNLDTITDTSNSTVKTDNWLFAFLAPHSFDSGQITGANFTNWISGPSGSSGCKKLLNPSQARSTSPLPNNYAFNHGFNVNDFGGGGNGYIYIVAPTRCGINPSSDLYQQAGQGPQGFGASNVRTFNYTNENGYIEEYKMFVSTTNSGIDTSIPTNLRAMEIKR